MIKTFKYIFSSHREFGDLRTIFHSLFATRLLLFAVFLLTPTLAYSQTIVRGFVRDSISGKSLPFALVHFEGSENIKKTNSNGFFEIKDSADVSSIMISLKDYKEKIVPVIPNQTNALDILIIPQKDEIRHLVEKSKKEKYKTDNNPAIAFIQQVIANKNNNRIESAPEYKFEEYEKLVLSVDDILKTLKSNKIAKIFESAYNDLEVSDFSGKPILTVSMKELLSDEFRKKKPKTEKSIIVAERHEGVDNATITKGLTGIWNETFSEIDIFEDEINFVFRKFVSPLSSTKATDFYKYYLSDTVSYLGSPCVKINFTPYNPTDLGFTGNFLVSLDEKFTIKKATLNIPKENNLNYIKQLLIVQEFRKQPNGLWSKSHATTTVKFDGFKVIYDLYAKRETFYRNYQINDSTNTAFDFPEDVMVLKGSEAQTDSFWLKTRPIPLKVKSQSAKDAESAFGRSGLFRAAMITMKILTSGYVHTTQSNDKNKFDIGPIGTFFSVNSIEGIRLKLGGETTSNLSKYFYLKGFGAYGTKDNKFKYSGTGTWSINGKHPEHDYGIHTLSFEYQYDVNTPGEQFFFTNKDNILLSFKHSKDDMMTYQKKGMLTYEKENDNGLTVRAWTHFQNEAATGSLQFATKDAAGNITDVGQYNASEIGIRLRYAHNNEFYQRRNAHVPVNYNAPVFYLAYSQGIKGYLNGEYNYQFTEISFGKMFWMSTFGHINLMAKTGRIWGDLPFPLLILPNANQSYTIQPESYSLLKPIEFINDKYASLDVAFHLNGVIFNKIPFIERFGLREVVTFKGLYGDLSDNNLPENNRDLFVFPENSGTMGKDPYMEASIGIENIMKIFRIDYVRRLSYLDNPDIARGGVRVALHLAF